MGRKRGWLSGDAGGRGWHLVVRPYCKNAGSLHAFVSNKPPAHVPFLAPFSPSPPARPPPPILLPSTMPTCRRKRVLLTEPSQALLEALKTDANKDVYYLAQTGEIFETYECVASPKTIPCTNLTYPFLDPQGLRLTDVLLPHEALPMRGHRQKRLRLLPGNGERATRGPHHALQVPRTPQVRRPQSRSMAYVQPSA